MSSLWLRNLKPPNVDWEERTQPGGYSAMLLERLTPPGPKVVHQSREPPQPPRSKPPSVSPSTLRKILHRFRGESLRRLWQNGQGTREAQVSRHEGSAHYRRGLSRPAPPQLLNPPAAVTLRPTGNDAPLIFSIGKTGSGIGLHAHQDAWNQVKPNQRDGAEPKRWHAGGLDRVASSLCFC